MLAHTPGGPPIALNCCCCCCIGALNCCCCGGCRRLLVDGACAADRRSFRGSVSGIIGIVRRVKSDVRSPWRLIDAPADERADWHADVERLGIDHLPERSFDDGISTPRAAPSWRLLKSPATQQHDTRNIRSDLLRCSRRNRARAVVVLANLTRQQQTHRIATRWTPHSRPAARSTRASWRRIRLRLAALRRRDRARARAQLCRGRETNAIIS